MSKVMTVKGKETGENVTLPPVFTTPYRPDLIKRAFDALKANTRQPQGVDPAAGLKTSADYFGNRRRSYRVTINRAMSRLPRTKPGGGGLGPVRRVPQSVGGRRAHPSKTEKKHSRKINKKEYMLALKSALAAAQDKKILSNRNHDIKEIKTLPLIMEDKFQEIQKTRDLKQTLEKLGLKQELNSNKKHAILIIIGEDKGIRQASKNIPGVEVARVNELDLDLLAPGSQAGILTLYTQEAIEKIGEAFQ